MLACMSIIITDSGIVDTSFKNGTDFQDANVVYEVLRVIDGIPLFLENHYERLLSSLKIQGWQFEMDYHEFKEEIGRLIELTQKITGNIKFELTHKEGQNTWRLFFIPHSYPTMREYKGGVPVDLLLAERTNPNAKVIQSTIRERANQLISEKKLYEVLLVDQQNRITEGSRSNVFFVKNGVFYTAPSSMVLVGITRLKVFECLKKLNFRLIEEAIWADQTDQFDAVFLTGTSPKVLPVAKIGNHTFSVSNPFVLALIKEYNAMIDNYIKSEKR